MQVNGNSLKVRLGRSNGETLAGLISISSDGIDTTGELMLVDPVKRGQN